MTPIEKVRAALDLARKHMHGFQPIDEALRELDGMVLVPVLPTYKMLECACNTDLSNIGYASPVGLRITPEMFIAESYKAMIAPYLPEVKQNDR